FSVTGISETLDLRGPSEFDAEIKASMIGIARRVVLVADSGKFGRDSYVRVVELAAVQDVVTDDRLSSEWLARLEEAGIRVHVAPGS
ncbi:MAG: D-beta-D-heptose 1-phosphate adenosyltransferase, partial [Chloroflexota bacterium]